MHRALVLHDLQLAERHVVAAKKQITDQIEFIAWLGWFGNDAAGARGLLREFERGLAKHICDRERLRAQLAHLDEIDALSVRQARHKLSGREAPASIDFT